MAERFEITDAERGLESAPPTQQAASPDVQAAALKREEHWLAQATRRIEAIEAGNAKPGWKLTQAVIDDLYFSDEAADPRDYDPFDISVGAIITWELIEKDMDQGINYAWSREDYVLGELIYPGTPKERRTAVKTDKTIRWRNKQIAKEAREQLDAIAKQQKRGEDQTKSQEKLDGLRQELHENNDELIKRAETPEEFEEAMSNIETDQSLGGDDDGAQFNELGQQYDKKKDWIREDAERRPNSPVSQLRHIRNKATEQSIGVADEPEDVRSAGLSEVDKAIIRDNARKYAQDNAPSGFDLVSVDVQFNDTSKGRFMTHKEVFVEVVVTAHYEGGIDERGLPSKKTAKWKSGPNALMKYPDPKRRPVKKVPYEY